LIQLTMICLPEETAIYFLDTATTCIWISIFNVYICSSISSRICVEVSWLALTPSLYTAHIGCWCKINTFVIQLTAKREFRDKLKPHVNCFTVPCIVQDSGILGQAFSSQSDIHFRFHK